MIPNRLKVVAATGLLIGGIGAAALSHAFAAPLPDVSTAPTPVAPVTPGALHTGRPIGWRGGAGFSGLAQFFGMSTTDLQTAFRNGQSFAQIAAAHGKSVADLKAYFTSQLKTRLDAAVAAGKMTSQQEQTILTNASSRLDKMINANPSSHPNGNWQGKGRGARGGFAGGWLQPVAGFLGITQSALNTAIQNGQTLAQIASANGKTAAQLEAFLTSQLKTRLDAAVSAGKMTSQQEQTALGNASSRINNLINANLKNMHARGFGWRHGSKPTPAASPTATPSGA